jgi:hypothetical protein
LCHKLSSEGLQIPDLYRIIRRYDEAELVSIGLPALFEFLSVNLISRRPVKLAGAALTCDAVTLDVT